MARAKTAQAQNQMMDAARNIDVLDPTSELSRFEEKVRREEAKALGKQELADSSLDAQFEQLEGLGDSGGDRGAPGGAQDVRVEPRRRRARVSTC